MVGPHRWAGRRQIMARRQNAGGCSIVLELARQWAPARLQPFKLPLEMLALTEGLRRHVKTYRTPLARCLGAMAGVVVLVMVAHEWRIDRTPSVAAPLAMSPVRARHPAEAAEALRTTNGSSIHRQPVRASSPAQNTALGLANDGTITVVAQSSRSHAEGFNLDITSPLSLWAKAGARYHIDPVLIYAVALVETRGVQPDGSVAPSPWIVRINGHVHNGGRAESEHAIELAHLLAVPVQDVGIMQVYYPVHRDMEPDPIALLNPARNIDVGTRLLRKAMKESSDPVLRIGYYHSHDAELARGYGEMVLNVYKELKTAMGKSPGSVLALEHAKADMVAMHSGG